MTDTRIYQEPIALPELFGETGISLDAKTDFDEWSALGQNLLRFARSHQWWVGDWLAFGEDKFGEEAPQAVEILGLDPKTLMNYRRVAGRIPLKDRRPFLSWTHHRIVADLDGLNDRRKILKQAEMEVLTTREVQTLVDGIMKEEPEGKERARNVVTCTVSFTVDVMQEKHGLVILENVEKYAQQQLDERGIEPTRMTASHT